MPDYSYKAIDAQGKVVKGTDQAHDLDSLTAALKEKGLFLMEGQLHKIAPSSAAVAVKRTPPAKPPRSERDPVPLTTRLSPSADVPLDRISIFTTELSIMVRTAIPIAEAINTLARQQKHPVLKKILVQVGQGVNEGRQLSQAMAPFSSVFDHVYISLLAAGENSGNMPLMLDRISDYVMFRRDLKEKVRSALMYPIIILLTTLLVVTFLVVLILPTFATLFKQMAIQLPLPTRVLLDTSTNLRHWWSVYSLGALAFWFFASRWARSPAHSEVVDTVQLRIPVVGIFVRNIVMTRVLRTLSALVSSGVPILKSLSLAKESSGNYVFRQIIDRVHESASAGTGLAAGMSDTAYIPEQVAHMIGNGERTGTLPDVLTKIADFYEKETETALKNMFAMMEPIFVIILGIAVAGIAVSILLPIFKLDNAIK